MADDKYSALRNNLFVFVASPVMRDTITALLAERDELLEVKRQLTEANADGYTAYASLCKDRDKLRQLVEAHNSLVFSRCVADARNFTVCPRMKFARHACDTCPAKQWAIPLPENS